MLLGIDIYRVPWLNITEPEVYIEDIQCCVVGYGI